MIKEEEIIFFFFEFKSLWIFSESFENFRKVLNTFPKFWNLWILYLYQIEIQFWIINKFKKIDKINFVDDPNFDFDDKPKLKSSKTKMNDKNFVDEDFDLDFEKTKQ